MSDHKQKVLIKRLAEQIRQHDYLYYDLARAKISDLEYDLLRRQYEHLIKKFPEFIPANDPSKRIGFLSLENYQKHPHLEKMMSLSNAFSKEEIQDYLKKMGRFLGNNDFLPQCSEPKIDGISVSLRYKRGLLTLALTRGDGLVGEDITHNIRTISDIPWSINLDNEEVDIRGEVYMTHSDFSTLNKERLKNEEAPFSNPRNATSGTLRQLNLRASAKRTLHFFAYYIKTASDFLTKTQSDTLILLKDLGFVVNPLTRVCQNVDEMDQYYREIEEKRSSLDYDIDGVVYKVDHFDMQKRLGSIDRTPRFAIAYKFLADAGITRLIDIHLQVGRSGVITPVAILEPIILNNVTITRATLHNFDEIERKDIRIGDHVFIKRAGDVIPKIQGVFFEKRTSQETAFMRPTYCPCCKTILTEDGTFLRCSNGFACRAQALARFEHFISAKGFNVQGMGPKILEKLYDMNILRNYADFFKLATFKEELIQTPGFGEIICQKLLERIEYAKTIPLSSFIYALGIGHVGEVTAGILAACITSIHDLGDKNTLSQCQGIGEETQKAIYDYIHDPVSKSIIKDLESYINVIQPQKNTHNTGKGPLAHEIVLFTGTLTTMTRAQAKRYVEMLSGRVASSFSSHVTLLVYAEKPGSKLKKANEMNIKTINEEEWNSLIKNYVS